MTLRYKKDCTAPEGNISVTDIADPFTAFPGNVTYHYFFTEEKQATITLNPTVIGTDTAWYYMAQADLGEDLDSAGLEQIISEKGGWQRYSKAIPLAKDGTYVIYAKLTDEAGNTTYLKEGIVIFSDSAAVTEIITYTRTTMEDKSVEFQLNGNRISRIINVTEDNKVLSAEDNYTINAAGNTITLIGTYLNTLPAGDYTFRVSYSPQSIAYDSETADGDTPATTEFTAHIEKASSSLRIATKDMNKIYD